MRLVSPVQLISESGFLKKEMDSALTKGMSPIKGSKITNIAP